MALPSRFIVRKVAVLGAGVMGAQIAAHLVNAGVEAILFELPAKEGDPNGNVRKAIDGLKKLEPSPLSVVSRADHIQAANYDQGLELLKACDIVIEAISERMDWKKALYEKIAPIWVRTRYSRAIPPGFPSIPYRRRCRRMRAPDRKSVV